MTGAEFMAAAGFVLVLFGALFGVWKYIDGKLTKLRDDLSAGQLRYEASLLVANEATAKVAKELSAHQLRTAETYVTKAGMSEQTAQIMKALDSLGHRIDGIHERLDGFQRTTTRRS